MFTLGIDHFFACSKRAATAMAVALVNHRPSMRNAMSLFFRSLDVVRSFSDVSATPSMGTQEDEKLKPKKNKKKNLFDVAQFLPNWGIGYQMAKSKWRDLSYKITKINLYKDGRHGKVWGIRHKAGLPVSDTPVKMSGVNKRGWKYINESKKKIEGAPKVEKQSSA
ncbi:hypothetical protein ZIOFF_042509 [Zingiber officinale]|uniref:Uncharacterized protein n=2 Tax=Zingiber officinale TaxID=94328 RepID=A0A8J5FTD1_ZINOF|nr:hypothetical protein ZIOFF_042509 [Zingiber officinale]